MKKAVYCKKTTFHSILEASLCVRQPLYWRWTIDTFYYSAETQNLSVSSQNTSHNL